MVLEVLIDEGREKANFFLGSVTMQLSEKKSRVMLLSKEKPSQTRNYVLMVRMTSVRYPIWLAGGGQRAAGKFQASPLGLHLLAVAQRNDSSTRRLKIALIGTLVLIQVYSARTARKCSFVIGSQLKGRVVVMFGHVPKHPLANP